MTSDRARSIDRVEAALEELETLLPEGGWANNESLQRARAIASGLRWSGLPLGDKPGSILAWLDILFSARKHEKYSGGAAGVRSFIRGDIESVRMILNRLRSRVDDTMTNPEREMPTPPFDVTIRIDRPTRGVYQHKPIVAGAVSTPTGVISVEMAIETLAPRRGQPEPPEEPVRFSVMFNDVVLRIDATEMLERIVNAYLKDSPPDLRVVE